MCREVIRRPSAHRAFPGRDQKTTDHRNTTEEPPRGGVESAIARTWRGTGVTKRKIAALIPAVGKVPARECLPDDLRYRRLLVPPVIAAMSRFTRDVVAGERSWPMSS